MGTRRSKASTFLALGLLAGCARLVGDDSQIDAAAPVDSGAVDAGLDTSTPQDVVERDVTPTVDAATPCQGKPDCARYVFVSSEAVKGIFPSIADADQHCTEDAAKSPKLAGRRFFAWISSNAEDISPAKRFAKGTQPYMRMDGVVVAKDWAELASNGHQAPLNHDVYDDQLTGKVWTGTKADGTPHMNQCLSWKPMTEIQMAASGETARVDAKWTESDLDACSVALHRLYCIEQ